MEKVRYILLAIVLLLASCRSTKTIKENEASTTYTRTSHETSKADSMISEKTEQTINFVDSLLSVIDITETTFDTSVTDSDGTHPVKAIKRIRNETKGYHNGNIETNTNDSTRVLNDIDKKDNNNGTSNCSSSEEKQKSIPICKMFLPFLILAIIVIYSRYRSAKR